MRLRTHGHRGLAIRETRHAITCTIAALIGAAAFLWSTRLLLHFAPIQTRRFVQTHRASRLSISARQRIIKDNNRAVCSTTVFFFFGGKKKTY